jgi:sugar-phosphatase
MTHPMGSKDQCSAITIRGLIFDMDGTLVETELANDQVWRRWAEKHNLDLPRLLRAARGRRTIDTVREFCPPGFSPEEETALIELQELEETNGVCAVSGALDFLNSIPVSRWAVVTSNTKRLAEIRLRAVDIVLPKVLISCEDVSCGKPDPEGYLKAAEALGCKPSDVVVFEDSEAGVQAGKASGATIIVVGQSPHLAKRYGGHQIVDFIGMKLSIADDGEFQLDIPPHSERIL